MKHLSQQFEFHWKHVWHNTDFVTLLTSYLYNLAIWDDKNKWTSDDICVCVNQVTIIYNILLHFCTVTLHQCITWINILQHDDIITDETTQDKINT